MTFSADSKPKLRPIQVFPTEHEGRRLAVLHDPGGLADGDAVLSEAAVFILIRLDGEHTVADIRREFAETFGQPLPSEQLDRLLDQLEERRFLDGPAFAAHLEALTAAYRAAPTRQTQVDAGIGCDLHQLPMALREILADASVDGVTGELVGLIAPHLDLRRGWECYADAYGVLERLNRASRFVVLGTNHFGRSHSVVATRKAFETPLGIAEVDVDFVDRLSRRCGVDLCADELDHRREHSVEMQVFFLQYLMHRQPFRVVPVLCPDPCGPTGTAPADGRGIDLRHFAEALGDELRSDGVATCIIAGADLSHIGRRFGDDKDLDAAFLHDVETRDRTVLGHVEACRPEAFREAVGEGENPTRICSAGCMYALMTALNRLHEPSRLSARLLRYHQAADAEAHTGVTCAAVAFTLTG